MKLKKLLLPIASVVSTAAIVAPIVTSCGGTTIKFEHLDSEGKEVAYESIIEPKESSETFTKEKALSEYLKDASKNKKIIADDYFYYEFGEKPENASNHAGDKETFTFTVNKVDTKNQTMSVKLTVYTKEIETSDKDTSYSKITEETMTYEYRNIKVAAQKVEDDWIFSSAYTTLDSLKNDENWEIKEVHSDKFVAKSNGFIDKGSSHGKLSVNSKSSDYNLEQALLFLSHIYYPSHYFINIKG